MSVDLTPREHQVLHFAAEGLSIVQMAGKLHIGASTAKHHTQELRRKLGAPNLARAVARGYQLGILSVGERVCCHGYLVGWLKAAASAEAGTGG